ncbi:MAG: septal ring lytic transglycosylase RlpA family protein [Desulfosarcinaceae bacterium]|nr:septal ring lytic transglycosylase RlpA family protein [Desulfosarcinaceae bacterium]
MGRHLLPFWCLTALLALLALSACAPRDPAATAPVRQPKPYRVDGVWYQPMASAEDFRQRGIASWYGKAFHGRKTSNGETYNMYGLSAAHKTLPLGTWVRVRNLENDRSLELRINDRGPFVRGRVIDLSYGAAKKLGVVGPGTAKVEVVALGVRKPDTARGERYTPIDYYSGQFTFQVGAFGERRNAERLRDQLKERYANAHIVPFVNGDDIFYRVRVGRCTTLEEAALFEERLVQAGYGQAFIVAE